MAKIDMTGQSTTGETTPFGQPIYIIGDHNQVIENYDLICKDCKNGETFTSIQALKDTPCIDVSGAYVEDTTALMAGYAAAHEIRETSPELTAGGCSCTPSNGPDCVSCR